MNVVDHADFKEGVIHTRWVDLNMAPLAEPSEARQRYVSMQPATAEGGFAGAKVDTSDPLALFAHDAGEVRKETAVEAAPAVVGPNGSNPVKFADSGHHCQY